MRTNGQPSMTRWLLATAGVFLVVYIATVLLTGEPEFLLVGVLIALLLAAIFGVNFLARKRIEDTHHGSMDKAMEDNQEDIPAAHLLADDETALGDTDEAHDELSPHDLPITHPGRKAAEELVAREGDGDGTTRGHAEGGASGEDGHESTSTERTAPA